MTSRRPPEPVDGGNARSLYALAQQQERTGDRAAAIATLTRAVALEDMYANAHQLLGILYGEGGDAERAAQPCPHAYVRLVHIV